MKTSASPPAPARLGDGLDERGLDVIRVRGIRPEDADEIERFYAALSPDSRRTRFFSLAGGLDHAQSASFCATDHDHREGFVAVAGGRPDGRDQIVGHLCLEPDGTGACEVAIAVADAFQHRGIGRQLLAAGVAWARRQHVARFTATMLAGNAPIQRLLRGLGLPVRERWLDAGTAEIEIDLPGELLAA